MGAAATATSAEHRVGSWDSRLADSSRDSRRARNSLRLASPYHRTPGSCWIPVITDSRLGRAGTPFECHEKLLTLSLGKGITTVTAEAHLVPCQPACLPVDGRVHTIGQPVWRKPGSCLIHTATCNPAVAALKSRLL